MPALSFFSAAGRWGRQAWVPSTSLRPSAMIFSSAATVADTPDAELVTSVGTWKPACAASAKPSRFLGRSTELALDFGALRDMPVASERVALAFLALALALSLPLPARRAGGLAASAAFWSARSRARLL